MQKSKSFGARMLLAAIGGLAAAVAGAQGHYVADQQTPKKKSNRSRIGRGNYGKSLRGHFDRRGINWSAKPNKAKRQTNQSFRLAA